MKSEEIRFAINFEYNEHNLSVKEFDLMLQNFAMAYHKEQLNIHDVSGCFCEWKEKVKQLMTGLEAQHIDEFMNEANIDEYFEYGVAYIEAARNKINNR